MNELILCPGFVSNNNYNARKGMADMFCSFSTFNIVLNDNQKQQLNLINYSIDNETLIYCFNLNKFYISKSFSTCYSKMVKECQTVIPNAKERTTFEFNGLDHSLFNNRFNKNMNIVNEKYIDRFKQLSLCENSMFSIKEFAVLILDLCLKHEYDETSIKEELIQLFKNYFKHEFEE